MSDLLHTKQRSSTCHQGIVAKLYLFGRRRNPFCWIGFALDADCRLTSIVGRKRK